MTEPQHLTPDSIVTAAASEAPQPLDSIYRLVDSKVISDENPDDDFFESYSHVLIRERSGTFVRELVDLVQRDGETALYGRVKYRDHVPKIDQFEGLEHFYQYLILLGQFTTLDSSGNMASGVQAIKSWSGFAIESGAFRVLWVNLDVSIQYDDDQWNIYGHRITQLTYSATDQR